MTFIRGTKPRNLPRRANAVATKSLSGGVSRLGHGMRFFALSMAPRGEADTEYSEDKAVQGEAARCPRCGAFVSMLSWLPPLRATLQLYGTTFGDFAFMGGSDDFLVSQKFRDVYHGYGLTGLSGFEPVEITKTTSRRKKKLPQPPAYFRVCAEYGQTALDLAASGFEWLEQPTCPVCQTATIVRWKRLIVNPDTWHGEDAFRPRGLSGTTMVSQRFKDACELNGIRNAVFEPAESSGHDFYPWDKTPKFTAPA
jgi:hypothetical protein